MRNDGLELFTLRTLVVCCAAIAPAAWAQSTAEIVLLVGKGEKRITEQAPWTPAIVKEKVSPGGFVRTLADSQMGLYLPDRSPLRLGPKSEIQIKSIADAAKFTETNLQLNAGRAWSHAKPQALPPGAAEANKPRVNIQTATATMGVRGTEWEIEVGPDGETQLVVLSGQVEMSNELGSLSVGPGQAAVAKRGSAPTRLVLVNPAARVQWVSSWRPDPKRWAGGDAARHAQAIARIEAGDYVTAVSQLRPLAATDMTAALLLSDVLMHEGDIEAAVTVLSAHRNSADPRVASLLARALSRQDKMPEARATVAAALQRSPNNVELLIAQGELAALDGDAAGSRASYNAALAVEPRNAEAWYGVGLVESEREDVRKARVALNEALKSNPQLSRATSELAATETFAGNLEEARRLLEDLLAREPENYQAMTALGLYKLKSGQPQAALDDFLKAGLIEPRYSRARLYAGVAFYQLGDVPRAIEAFGEAAALDPHDPVPHVYRGIVQTDHLEYGAAIESARNAQQRMPFLRSLNQVASNQKGSANVGTSLANFGLEEWANYYAQEASTPYWGGSHLFLADRYTGKFNRNSELFQGFLTEPTAFGAPNRRSSLVTVPGHYGRIDVAGESGDWRNAALTGTFNGMAVSPVPMAYYFSGDLNSADSVKDDSSVRSRNAILGLGMKPRHDLGIFVFATDGTVKGPIRNADLPNDRIEQSESRFDLGLNFKLSPVNQFWVKGGSGRQANDLSGTVFSSSAAATLNTIAGIIFPPPPPVISPSGMLDSFSTRGEQRDFQFRHSFDAGALQWSWGLERSRQERKGQLALTLTPMQIFSGLQSEWKVDDVWASVRTRFGAGHEVQADLFHQRTHLRRDDTDRLSLPAFGLDLFNTTTSVVNDFSEWNPRFGVKWQLAPMQSLRIAAQEWRRPASVGSLAPVDTAGVAVNDRIVSPGGLYKRARLQYDGELGASTFVQAFGDHERINNGPVNARSPVTDFELRQLESLRNKPDIFSARNDLEDTPKFVEGKISSFGFAVNHLLSKTTSLSMRYLRRDANQSGTLAGRDIPFVPRDYLQLGAQWAPGNQWLMGASAIYRSARFKEDTNVTRIDAGWSFGLTAYWESTDKRHSLQGILDNLLTRKSAGNSTEPHLLVRYSYAF